MRVEIFYTRSGRGLTKDADLLTSVIQQLHHQVSATSLKPSPVLMSRLSAKWQRLKSRVFPAPVVQFLDAFQRIIRRWFGFRFINADLIIHLENVHPSCIRPGRTNLLIPNQEWFRPSRLHYLQDIDQVLCKTHAAETCFMGLHRDIRYLGFSSPQARQVSLPGNHEAETGFLHVAGTSSFKGTAPVIDSWLKHPEWPTLTLVADNIELPTKLPANIRHCSRLTNQEMQQLWQTATFAVMPSEVEGFGQILIEAMVNGAVAITTDAPPMNELVTPDRGYLVPHASTQQCRLGKRYLVTDSALENTIKQILATGQDEWNTKITNAGQWVESNHQQFVQNVQSLLTDIEQRRQSLDK